MECVKFLMLLALVLSLANCGLSFSGKGKGKSYVVKGRRYYILASANGVREKGLASWYGEPFHGRKTASGEVYDMDKISAAHKTLPLHTWVEVRNLENNRSMTLRINDRGPFVPGRVIDLSRAAARELGVYGPGLAKVRLRAVTGHRAQQLTAIERASQGLALLAQAGPALLAGGRDDRFLLAQGPIRAPSAGDGSAGHK
ncbi:MAG: septal ring lytic transglycosylase RlpA family protein [Candidatus Adiutrix sp.]|nr:septal ring lytic transglycosylase RlpA family protein [Candidatus Adiutrix sp.]